MSQLLSGKVKDLFKELRRGLMKEVTGGKGPEEGPLPVECGGSL